MLPDQIVTPKESPLPPVTKEDYIIRLLEEIVRFQKEQEGPEPQLFIFEGDLSAGASTKVEADFPHDAFVVYFRSDANVTLRISPLGPPGANTAGIEIRNNSAVRVKSTSNALYLLNTGSATAHYFVIALSRAEVEFYSLA